MKTTSDTNEWQQHMSKYRLGIIVFVCLTLVALLGVLSICFSTVITRRTEKLILYDYVSKNNNELITKKYVLVPRE